MEAKKQQLIEEPRFVPLWELLDCPNCSQKHCSYAGRRQEHSGPKPKSLWDCYKKTQLIDFGLTYIPVILIMFIFMLVFHHTHKLFLSIFISASTKILALDLLFYLLKDSIKEYYKQKEAQRKNQYATLKENFIKMQEMEEQRQKELEQKEIQKTETIKELCKHIQKLKNLVPFRNIQEYSQMVNLLQEICKNLNNARLDDYENILFFNVQLPEFKETCKKIKKLYNNNTLSKEDFNAFTKLLKSLIVRLEHIKITMLQPQKEDLLVQLQTLNEALDTANNYDAMQSFIDNNSFK